ncbi:hypothetical protein [Leptolyngbya sp. 7M]|uniref:hypothetical protein n=1 Tax=Leptolyngbya sp. 7M TaxID=2812896 RepID=UPI001B8D0E55|nr:hypothetical protein [Leptolyngbya sp. 7M]QYO65169.1 hypothetical protein JVX88_37750 [Leptolyngbya sp. 7M]
MIGAATDSVISSATPSVANDSLDNIDTGSTTGLTGASNVPLIIRGVVASDSLGSTLGSKRNLRDAYGC